jgi:hypothetical protein
VEHNDSESSCYLSESLRFNDLHTGNSLLITEQKVDNIMTRRGVWIIKIAIVNLPMDRERDGER